MAAVLLFVCAAVYLNWTYNSRMGQADPAMAEAEDAAMTAAEQEYLETAADENQAETVSVYFAQARLTRQQSRDEALSLLETAASSENASQETIDSAMDSIAAMATWSMQEAQIENLLLAKDFDDCVVYISGESITVAVPAPAQGLSEAAVARITDTITGESDFSASQIKLIEVKDE
jgi:stage III sporulation protein AH